MNQFGGDWTENKIEILVEYAKAYLKIMNTQAPKNDWKLLYFDGFAGSGYIKKGKKENHKLIVGAAKRILELENPRPFDMFYFVEKNIKNANSLKENTELKFPRKKIYIVSTDCNEKIKSMSTFLSGSSGKKFKTLAYIDPCGMQLRWNSLEQLKELSIDAWILVPTGMGVNRLLKRNGEISDTWVARLEVFLGMKREEILQYFYKKKVTYTLFGEETTTTKEEQAIEKSAILYTERLASLFSFVSKPYILRNRSNTIMFHFFMVSKNETAVKIANSIIKKYNQNP